MHAPDLQSVTRVPHPAPAVMSAAVALDSKKETQQAANVTLLFAMTRLTN
jgi:16S rRNA A1518/A1519 N6-dimethyltransferase RsmA/KsgA/DIM1 with predicted DNA glycosylase/AP lyase activity